MKENTFKRHLKAYTSSLFEGKVFFVV